MGAFPQASSFALVIGVERYRSLPEPTGARRDAEEFARMLWESMGVPDRNVTVLLDDAATRSDIESELGALKSRVPAGSRIYFFFSGHGSPDVETGSSYVLPYEGTPENLRFSGISVESIVAALEETEARR